MKMLLVDLSNSTSKFALSTPKRLLSRRSLPTASLSQPALTDLLEGWDFQYVLIASVVPKATQVLTKFFKAVKIPLLSINASIDLGFKINYPNPNHIGADRLANVAGTIALYKTPAIVVDFGTAITFDIIDDKGAYLGGVIAPGLTTSAEALHLRTALLPLTKPTPIRRALGKSTLTAIHSGLLLGAQGLVREVVDRVTQENFSGERPTVIATGGDAKLVAHGTTLFDAVNPELTLEGLREIGKI